jgi:hypothetical protein
LKYIVYISILILFLISCSDENHKNNRKKVVSVNGTILYENELINDFPSGLLEEDSINFINQYINNWIKDQLVLKKAEDLLPEHVKNINNKVKKYRNSLITYEYEQIYIKKRLDTIINDEEIEGYYNDHSDDFILKDYIVKCMYLKINKNAPDQKNLKKSYLLNNEEDELFLRTYSLKHAIEFYYNNEEWVYFDEILKKIPLQDFNKKKFIQKKKKLTFEEDNFIYYINIYDFRLEDGVSPLSFEKEKIRSIILNMRSTELRKKLKADLHNDALKNKSIEYYKND